MNADEMKRASRGMGVDMSPEAIARRIDIVSQLRALTLALGKAEKVVGERGAGEVRAGLSDRDGDGNSQGQGLDGRHAN